MTDMSQFRELFLGEAEDLLAKMEQGLVKLEQNPKDGEVLREFFRLAHTLKGNAATMDFQRITELAHGIEDRMEPLKDGATEATHAVISALLACLDALRLLTSEVKEQKTLEVDIAGCLARLDKALGEGGGGSPAAPPAAPPPATPQTPQAPAAAPALRRRPRRAFRRRSRPKRRRPRVTPRYRRRRSSAARPRSRPARRARARCAWRSSSSTTS
jgi:chemotaxis protein histidine kinase CheA